MEVAMDITHATWSEVGLARGLTIVFGNFKVHAADVKKPIHLF
jgi:hypothetical protein